jgi:hypothetical protein
MDLQDAVNAINDRDSNSGSSLLDKFAEMRKWKLSRRLKERGGR